MSQDRRIIEIGQLALSSATMPLSQRDKTLLTLIDVYGQEVTRLHGEIESLQKGLAVMFMALAPADHHFSPNPDNPELCEGCGQRRRCDVHRVPE